MKIDIQAQRKTCIESNQNPEAKQTNPKTKSTGGLTGRPGGLTDLIGLTGRGGGRTAELQYVKNSTKT